MADISEKLAAYYAAVKAEADVTQAAAQNVIAALDALKETAGDSTFVLDGQHYQIRKRNGKTYLCELAGPPKGRPKGRTVKPVVEEVTPPETAEPLVPVEAN